MRAAAMSGWVLYDADCSFCVKWLRLWSPVLRRRGFEIDTLQADWAAGSLKMTREETLRDIRLLTVAGSKYAGADVYLYLARKIWWLSPFGVLFSLPVFNALIWIGYRWFAANRQCISGQCKLR